MTQKTIETEIAEEIEKRIERQNEKYVERFNGPTTATKKRWTKKIVQQVEAEKAQLSFSFTY
jgi:hypothetical protein